MNVEAFIDELIAKAAKSIAAEEGDYIGEDGLLYCHKCNTPKQTRIDINGHQKLASCLCKCAADAYEREKEADEARRFAERVGRMREAGFPDRQMAGWTFANDDGGNPRLMGIAHRFVDNFQKFRADGKGLLLYGTVGTGKSYAAGCIANALIDKGTPALMTNFSRIVNTLSGMWDGKQEYLDSLRQFPLLIIDDLGAERDTEFVNETVEAVIDARCRSKLPLIVTTNLTAEQLKNTEDLRHERAYSRIMEMCIPIECKGYDRRRKKLKKDYREYADILGITKEE